MVATSVNRQCIAAYSRDNILCAAADLNFWCKPRSWAWQTFPRRTKGQDRTGTSARMQSPPTSGDCTDWYFRQKILQRALRTEAERSPRTVHVEEEKLQKFRRCCPCPSSMFMQGFKLCVADACGPELAKPMSGRRHTTALLVGFALHFRVLMVVVIPEA